MSYQTSLLLPDNLHRHLIWIRPCFPWYRREPYYLGTRCLTSLGVGGGYHDGLDSSVFALVEYVSLDGGDVVSGDRGFGFLAARETQA